MADLVAFLDHLVRANPLLGVFLASLLGNVIPFFPVPYLLLVVFVASANTGPGLVPLATIAALGAAIGKFSSYLLGYGARQAFTSSRVRFDSLRKLLGGSIFLAALLFAASPFPDDVIFIPMGAMRYSPLKTFISLFAGKFTLTILVTYAGSTSLEFLVSTLGGSILVFVGSIAITIVLVLLMMKVHWEKMLTRAPGAGKTSRI